jgi:hypothetical protein
LQASDPQPSTSLQFLNRSHAGETLADQLLPSSSRTTRQVNATLGSAPDQTANKSL